VSSASPRHKKPSRFSSGRAGPPVRHRKLSPITFALQRKPARIAAAVAGSTLIVSGVVSLAATQWPAATPGHVAQNQADALTGPGAGLPLGAHASRAARPGAVTDRRAAGLPAQPSRAAHAGRQRRQASAARPAAARRPAHRQPSHRQPSHRQPAHRQPAQRHQRRAAEPVVYRNPLRSISGLIPERIDMGVDFGGSGPIYALGNAVITNAIGDSAGWPGGGWITYRLTDGPASGLMVYVAEDVKPNVRVGQHVSSSTVIANMFDGGAGIETGWAQPNGNSAESQLPAAGSISGSGPFPARVGLNFEELLQVLGVTAANNRTQAAFGIVPRDYPTDWAAAMKHRRPGSTQDRKS